MITQVTSGRYTAAVEDTSIRPNLRVQGQPLVVYCHGGGNDSSEAIGEWGMTAVPAILRALAQPGRVVAAATSTNQWNNATALTRLAAAVTYEQARGATGPLTLVGASAGAALALTYAATNPVACVIGFIPAIDLQAIRVADTLGLRASIDTAHGVTYPAALPAGTNPAERTADLTSTPIQLWYASDDTVSANIATFATATGAELNNVGALGHTAAAVTAVDANDVAAFAADNG